MTISRCFDRALPELTGLLETPKPSPENDAALRQLTHQRIMGYGVEYGDASRVRASVEAGRTWQEACEIVAESLLSSKDFSLVPQSARTRSGRLYRASALLRMAQMMMLRDDPERKALYRRASELFEAAMGAQPGWTRVLIPCRDSYLVGWYLAASNGSREKAILAIGGIEGWAMDAEPTVRDLPQRGFSVLMLDGPGQGESRFDHGIYLAMDWKRDVACAVDYLKNSQGARRIGILGNSMGGSFAMHYASFDDRIVACCNNGGLHEPLLQKQRPNFFQKMASFCEPATPEKEVDAIWASLNITSAQLAFKCPFLIVQGGADPLVSVAVSKQMLDWSASSDKQMHVFAGGNHCIYDKPTDKTDLIGDWFESRM